MDMTEREEKRREGERERVEEGGREGGRERFLCTAALRLKQEASIRPVTHTHTHARTHARNHTHTHTHWHTHTFQEGRGAVSGLFV